MFQRRKTQYKFKTYKSDAAPFFFFIDIFPLDSDNFDSLRSSILANQIKTNPIMPLPMRVDRVFNGESSIVIRPNAPISFPINDSINAIINPIPFFQLGFEKLLFFTEMRSHEKLFLPLKQEKVNQWWKATRFLYGNLNQIEEDFSAFLRAYLYTMIKANVNDEDIIGAAIEYCEIVNKICKEKMMRNSILVETNQNQEKVKLYREKTAKYRTKLKTVKKIEYHPELIDIEVYDLSENGFLNRGDFKEFIAENFDNIVIKYIPLLLYDDLQECMLQNLNLLETNEIEVLNPSILLEKNVIIFKKPEEIHNEELNKYSWLNDLNEVDIKSIFDSITETLTHFSKKNQIDSL
ncbi:MAG: hypothetical protein EAX89_01045 [Candidatus Lokiarchaeota archaeon]|nr:hypothetical protein [Candidatus Lokiarchaeota archaeon]